MATEYALFTAALGLSAPWEVSDIRFDAQAKRIDFDITFTSGSRFACQACGAEAQAVHDTRQRSWQHLHFFEHQAYIHAAVPRVRCQDCGKTTQVEVPWARPGSGFSQLFEAMVITLCQQMPVQKVANYLGVGDDPIWRILNHYVEAARAQEDFSKVRAVGIDETASRHTLTQLTELHYLSRTRLKTARAWRLKEALRDILTGGGTRSEAEQNLNAWY
ncbi:helix-turn-helix domain-containing protein, partial [Halorhodospira halochloris]|uniref:helix-turn-helix domain-containing protein n=1 Tax=Halorhodospira halochloris TaxID=1052 RepID=UPI001EE99840